MSALAFDYITARLRAHMDVFRGLLSGASDEQARWKPSPDKWSLLEVTNHLADEEVEDFRTRVRLTIEGPDLDWSRIDPERWPWIARITRATFENRLLAWCENGMCLLRG